MSIVIEFGNGKLADGIPAFGRFQIHFGSLLIIFVPLITTPGFQLLFDGIRFTRISRDGWLRFNTCRRKNRGGPIIRLLPKFPEKCPAILRTSNDTEGSNDV